MNFFNFENEDLGDNKYQIVVYAYKQILIKLI